MPQYNDLLGGGGPPTPPPPPPPFGLVTTAVNTQTVYADGCLFAVRIGSVVRLTFTETIQEPADGPTPGLKVRHVGNLAMPIEGFNAMMEYLNSIKDTYINPPPPPPPPPPWPTSGQ